MRPHRLRDAPPGVRLSLLALLAVAAALYAWNAASSGYSDYYATAVKSMSTSWRALFFGAFDPAATITLDKLSGFLVPQALLVRLVGFHAWALAAPQVVMGVVDVAVTYATAARWTGHRGAFVAALTSAFMPVAVTTFSHPMEDGMLTVFVTLAVWAWQKSLDGPPRRYLLLAALFVGVAFQAKMLQAWIVLPVLAAVTLWTHRGALRRRLGDLALALVAVLAVSFSWTAAIALVPASSRPFIDGTTNNSIFTMVLGYNGVDRFLSDRYPGALPADSTASATGTVGLVPGLLGHLPLKFFVPDYATQVGWLYPLAIAGLVLGAVAYRSAPQQTGLRFAGLHLALLVVVLGLMSLPHTAYLAALLLPLSLLCAFGAVQLGRLARATTGRLRYAVPLYLAVQTTWALVLLMSAPSFSGLVAPAVAVLGYGAAVLSLRRALRRSGRRLRRALVAAALTAGMAGPALWSFSTLNPAYAGTANDAYAGPPAATTAAIAGQETSGGVGLDSNRVAPATAQFERQAYRYALRAAGGARFALATTSWRSAAPLILTGETRILPIGGFTGRVDSPTLAELKRLVATGQLKFVLVAGTKTTVEKRVEAWVSASCRAVPVTDYSTRMSAPSGERLVDCGTASGRPAEGPPS